MRPIWSVLVLLLLVPIAGAQVPSPYTLTVTADTADATVSVEEPATVRFTVEFSSQNPLDGQLARTIQVIATGPDGWTVAVSESVLSMTSGSSQTVDVVVSVSTATEEGVGSINLQARLAPFGLNAIPAVGPILDPDAVADASTDVDHTESITRKTLETVGPWIWFILLAILFLIAAIIKFILDARREYVRLEIDAVDVTVGAGKSMAIPVRVTNTGPSEDTIVFHIAAVDKGWAASLPVPELDLDSGKTEELQLIVSVPKDAKSGGRHAIGIGAHSAAAPRKVAERLVYVTVA